MKRKRQKAKSASVWREIKVRLPKSFIKELSPPADAARRPSLPQARGEAIMSQLLRVYTVGRDQGNTLERQRVFIERAKLMIAALEAELKKKGVDIEDIYKAQGLNDASAGGATVDNDKGGPEDRRPT